MRRLPAIIAAFAVSAFAIAGCTTSGPAYTEGYGSSTPPGAVVSGAAPGTVLVYPGRYPSYAYYYVPTTPPGAPTGGG